VKIEYQHQNPDNPEFIRCTLAVAIPDKYNLETYVKNASTAVMMRVGLALCSEKQYIKALGREIADLDLSYQDVFMTNVTFPEEGKSVCHFVSKKEKAGRTFITSFALSYIRATDHVRLEYAYVA
jgi:hypothetical protein